MAANRAGAVRNKRKRDDDGDAAMLTAALQKIYSSGCTLKVLSEVVKNMNPFLQEKYQGHIIKSCLKTVKSTLFDWRY